MQGDLIVDRILTDAKIQAEEIVAKAEKQATEMQREELSWQKEKSGETSKRLKQKEKEISSATDVSAKIECKKVELKSKTKLLEKIKKGAVLELCNMTKVQAKKFFEGLLKKNAECGDVVFWKCKSLTEKDILSLASVKKLSLEVKAGEKEGLFLCGERCDKNLLFETLVEDYIENNLKEISELLF